MGGRTEEELDYSFKVARRLGHRYVREWTIKIPL
jgi:hypothetical protein